MSFTSDTMGSLTQSPEFVLVPTSLLGSSNTNNNSLSIPRGTTQAIIIPCTYPDGSVYPLTSAVGDIRFLVKYDALDPDLSVGTLGLPGYTRGALITKTLIGGSINITNGPGGLAVISLAPTDTNNTLFNELCPLDTVVELYWGCKLYLVGGVEYDLLSGQYGTLRLKQGGVQAVT